VSQREEFVERLCRAGVVAVVRAPSSDALIDAAKALADGGVDCIEITMTTPNALKVIEACRAALGDAALIGVGSVLDGDTARAAIAAGAQFVVSPVLNLEAVEAAHAAALPGVPGAMTPTEIQTAYRGEADLVKVFPATRLGPSFFKDVLAPMPHLRLTPTGGVNLENAGDFIRAGARTLGVGSALVSKKALAEGDWAWLTQRAQAFVAAVADARSGADGG
jgi:2-dehydro-3-deoxyphosphogluconate aldolase/(4S)-4-hydroxy-2-oxoglutarate aldolase